jgi:phytoene desaturase
MSKVIVIGAGFSGLAAASLMAKQGHEVTLLEKNDQAGGRARQFKENGFTFDMGPSWYWMPEVFEDFFGLFNKSSRDFYDLKRLDPSYKVIFGKEDQIDLPAGPENVAELFESMEEGSGKKLNNFLEEAAYKYQVGMDEFVFKPGNSLLEFVDIRVFKSLFKLQMLTPISRIIRHEFKDERIRKILEFPVLFLGATPEKTPALYSLMNYADISLGTWYPIGGFHKVIQAMVDIAVDQGVEIKYSQNVEKIQIDQCFANKVITSNGEYAADVVVAAADYHHVESKLIEKKYQQYTDSYWDSRVMAPSSLLFYLGIDKKLKNLLHHNLFFDEDFGQHAIEIYEDAKWPTAPLFYACCPSITDPTVAPEGKENLFLLMPLAPGLKDSEVEREKYFQVMINRLEELSGQNITDHIIYKRSYAMKDFKNDYNAFKGNAYGLANTLTQTAVLKPKLKSKTVKNLFYCGQLTNPGPGVPPSLISGQVVAKEVEKYIMKNKEIHATNFS